MKGLDEWACRCGKLFEQEWIEAELGSRFRFCAGESWWRKLLGLPRHDIMIQTRDGTLTCTARGRSFRQYLR